MSEVYNVVSAGGKFVGKDGQERTSWNPIGKMFRNDEGKLSLLLYLTNEWYNIFPVAERDDSARPSHAAAHSAPPTEGSKW